jgi:pyruvate/2-oxoglutarate dehydrogenase complex dihydrolipoamide dehydrogenase (E3) component
MRGAEALLGPLALIRSSAIDCRDLARKAHEVMTEIAGYDILILGSGEAGKYLAWTFAKAGRRVALVERRLIGGSCPNIACLPSKNVIHSARVASLLRRGPEFGIEVPRFAIDMKAVRQRKRSMVDGLVAIHLDRFRASGAELIMGEGRFVAPKTLEVEASDGSLRRITGERVVIDVGTHAAVPNIPGLAESGFLTHIEALELDHIPEHLLVFGGGYVGLEFAQAMRRFGSRVTVLEQGKQFTAREDQDVSEALRDLFKDEGIDVILDARVLQVEGRSGERVQVKVRFDGGEQTIDASDILVAVGREPNTGGIGLELAGVKLDSRGFINVNERLETTAEDVWAVGDCAGSPQFTHVGFDDFRIVRDNWNGGNRTSRDRLVPYCVFTDPELGRVGLDETQARRAGIPYRIAKIPMTGILRARTLSETRGFLKALIDANSDRILGFTAFGAEAGELIAVVQTAMLTGAPYQVLRDAVMTHPTVAEGLTMLFLQEPLPPRH